MKTILEEMLPKGLEIPTGIYPNWMDWYDEHKEDLMHVIFYREGEPIGFALFTDHGRYYTLNTFHINEHRRLEGIGTAELENVKLMMHSKYLERQLPIYTTVRNDEALANWFKDRGIRVEEPREEPYPNKGYSSRRCAFANTMANLVFS